MKRDVAQPGSALAWGARGRGFESRRPDHHPAWQDGDHAAFVVRGLRPFEGDFVAAELGPLEGGTFAGLAWLVWSAAARVAQGEYAYLPTGVTPRLGDRITIWGEGGARGLALNGRVLWYRTAPQQALLERAARLQ
jgi:hypothetical protein